MAQPAFWEIALETQLKTMQGAQWLGGDNKQVFAAIWWEALSMPEPDNPTTIESFGNLINDLRAQARPALEGVLYAWPEQCREKMRAAAETLPSDVVITADILPSSAGFFAFEPPARTALDHGLTWQAAICWFSDDIGAVFYFVFEAIVILEGETCRLRPTPIWTFAWPFGDALDAHTQGIQGSRFLKDCRWLIAAFTSLNDGSLIDESPRLDRHSRRRLERQFGVSKIGHQFRVIQPRSMEP